MNSIIIITIIVVMIISYAAANNILQVGKRDLKLQSTPHLVVLSSEFYTAEIRGNHLSNTTCLTGVLQKW